MVQASDFDLTVRLPPGLEVSAIRKAIEYIERDLVDATGTIEKDKPVLIWRVDVVFLTKADWKYEGSTASDAGGGRTATFGVKEPAKKLRGTAVYKRRDIILRGGKPIPVTE